MSENDKQLSTYIVSRENRTNACLNILKFLKQCPPGMLRDYNLDEPNEPMILTFDILPNFTMSMKYFLDTRSLSEEDKPNNLLSTPSCNDVLEDPEVQPVFPDDAEATNSFPELISSLLPRHRGSCV